jgi:hypothetical protein
MCNPKQELDNAVSSIGSAGQSIINSVNKTADNFLRNPLPVIETVVLTSMNVPAPLASAAVGVANGQKIENIAISAAVSFAAQQAGAAAGDQVSPIEQSTLNQMGPQYADEALIKQIVTSASGTAAATALKNKNASFSEILTSGLSGAVNTLVTQQLKDQGFNAVDTKTIANATSAATNAILNGKHAGLAIGNSVLATTLSSAISEKVGTLTKNSETIQGLKTSYDSLIKDAKEFFTTNKIDELQTQATEEYKTAQKAQTDYSTIKPDFDTAYQEYIKNKDYVDNYDKKIAADGYFQDSVWVDNGEGGYYTPGGLIKQFQVGTRQVPGGWDDGDVYKPAHDEPIYKTVSAPDKQSFVDATNKAVATINELAPTVQAANDAAKKYQSTLALLSPLQDSYTKQYGAPIDDYVKQINSINNENTGIAQQLGVDVTKYDEQIKSDAGDITKQIAGDAVNEAKAVSAGFQSYADQQKAGAAGFDNVKDWSAYSSLSEGAQKNYADLVKTGVDAGQALTLSKAFDNSTIANTSKDPGINVAGGNDEAALKMASISAMPEMLGNGNEKAGPLVARVEDGQTYYARSITGTNALGQEYSYEARYDPQDKKSNISYAYSGGADPDTDRQIINGEIINGGTAISSRNRPLFDQDPNNNGVPTSKKVDFESEEERLAALIKGITDPTDWTKFKEAQAKVALANTPTITNPVQPIIPDSVQPNVGNPTVTGGGTPTVGNLPSTTGGGSPTTTGGGTPTTTGGESPTITVGGTPTTNTGNLPTTTGDGTPTTTGGGTPTTTGGGLPAAGGGAPTTTGGGLPSTGGGTPTTNNGNLPSTGGGGPSTGGGTPTILEPTKITEPTKVTEIPKVPATPVVDTTIKVPAVTNVVDKPIVTVGTPAAAASTPSPLLSMKLDSSPQFLTSKAPTSSKSILKSLKHLYGSLEGDTVAPLAVAAVASQTPDETEKEQESKFMATGGSTNDTGFSLNPPVLKEYKPTLLAAAPVTEQKSRLSPLRKLSERQATMQVDPYAMAKGGALDKYADAIPEGHKPEFITGLTGYYAQGNGTGQSDDIDAMLHNGDYVADADLVAALGDGSSKAGAEALEKFRRSVPHQEHADGGTAVPAKIADGEYVFPASFVTAIGKGDNKAGAKILDKMREAIRKHKRSAPNNKIPPKAKSPLDYLKMVKG